LARRLGDVGDVPPVPLGIAQARGMSSSQTGMDSTSMMQVMKSALGLPGRPLRFQGVVQEVALAMQPPCRLAESSD
jgi:hypothetical protein